MAEPEATIKVTNEAELIKLLNSLIPSVRNKVVLAGLKAGAKAINIVAKANLIAGKKNASTTNYSYYSSAFKIEKIKSKTAFDLGIKTGISDTKNGYKLRWLEFGTADRTTKSKPEMNRGKIAGYNFFFNAVRSQSENVYNIVSEAIIKSLEMCIK